MLNIFVKEITILLDIRDWSPGHEKMGKGISLNADEIEKLKLILEKIS